MATEYGYTIGMLTCYIDKDNMQDLVYNASYNYWAKTPSTNPGQATGNEIQVAINGSINLTEPNPENYIPFNDLTDEIVWSWIEPQLDIEQIKLTLDEQIEDIKHPTTEIKYINN